MQTEMFQKSMEETLLANKEQLSCLYLAEEAWLKLPKPIKQQTSLRYFYYNLYLNYYMKPSDTLRTCQELFEQIDEILQLAELQAVDYGNTISYRGRYGQGQSSICIILACHKHDEHCTPVLTPITREEYTYECKL